MTLRPDELVVRFVRSIGRPAEADYYLSLFRAERPESFAIIAASATVMREAAEALTMDLRFLTQLGLTPVIVFGLVEPAGGADHARAVERALAPAVEARLVGAAEAGAVARAGGVPLVVLGDAAATVDGRFEHLGDLAEQLATRKIIFVGQRSGLQPAGREPPSLVDLTADYQAMAAPGVLPPGQRELLRQIRRLIEAVPHRLTVAVTSPLDLLRELFTVRGAGTLVRRGTRIRRHPSIEAAGAARLQEVVETAFGRRLRAGFLEQPVAAVYVAGDFRGAAVVTPAPPGMYLSKFAVDVAARGEGVGRDLWRALIADHPALFWRSRADNPFASWYQQHCDGMARAGSWLAFWRGLPRRDIPGVIDWVERAPVDLE